MAVTLDRKKCADEIAIDLKRRVDILKADGIRPSLIVFTSKDPASQVYVKNKVKRGQEIGIDIEAIPVSDIGTLIEEGTWYEASPFIIQEPTEIKPSDVDWYLNEEFYRDIDGFSSYNFGKLATASNFDNFIRPCTPNGILTLMKYYGISYKYKNVVVIGRSNIVGKPMAIMLTNANATVTLCHSKTPYDSLIKHCEMADIIISATGRIDVLKGWKAKPNQVLVDVGMNRDENGKLCGDFSKATIENCYAYTPVPGGVGPMTVIELMRNTVEFWEGLNFKC